MSDSTKKIKLLVEDEAIIALPEKQALEKADDSVQIVNSGEQDLEAVYASSCIEEALRESEEKYRFLVEHNHDIIYTLAADGTLLFVSPAWTTLLGYAVDQVVGESFQKFIHPDDVADCLVWLENVIKTGKRQEGIEYRVRHLDGSWFWHTSSAVPLRDESGKVIGFEGTARDITENKLTKQSLNQIRENYETFFNSIDEFLFVLDEQGNIIHANKTVFERLGYSANELYGHSVLLVHPSERRKEAGDIVGQMLNGTTEFCPVPVITKAGMQIPVETRITHGIWDGKPVIFGVTKDISKVRLSEEKFSKVFQLNPSACGLSSLENRKYVEVNDAFYSLLGFDKDEVIGNTAVDLGILSADKIAVIIQNADENGNVKNVETELKTKRGDIKHVLLSSENIHVQDKKYRFTVVHDITERKAAEDKVRALLAEKELILKEVHHRIKNNLNTASSLLSLQAGTLSEPSAITALKDAGHRIQSMSVLYDQLYRSANFTEISLASYLPRMVDDTISNFPNSTIVTIEKHFDNFMLDAKRIQTLGIIINELLTNTMKYAFEGRTSGLVSVGAKELEGNITVTVEDDGIGLPETVSFDNNSGFGLQLVQALTEQLDGRIHIERLNGTKIVIEFRL